jgi:uncharacterized protein YqjF (DUF2071 family)
VRRNGSLIEILKLITQKSFTNIDKLNNQSLKIYFVKPLLTACWNNLVMLNFETDPTILQSYLPAGTTIDFYNNKCFISLVGFQFKDAKLKGLPIPFYQNFTQINLRFYVQHYCGNECKRGVVFIKEIANGSLLKAGAALLYHEHYCNLPTKQSVEANEQHVDITYKWNYCNDWNYLHTIAMKEKTVPVKNAIELFITHRYLGYTKINKHKTAEFKVGHPAWSIHKLQSYELYCNSKEIYGEQLHNFFSQKPACAFMVDGSFVKVYNKKLCTN